MIRGAASWFLLRVVIAFTILTTIAVLLRFWSAKILRRKFFLDDGFVIVSFVAMLAQQGLGIWGIYNGTGLGSSEMSPPEFQVQAKLLVASSTTWIVSTTTIKLAVLGLYMRIFTTAIFKRWAISLMVFVTCFGITFFIVFITHCHPVSQQWDPVPGGWCRDLSKSELSSNVINLVLDTIIVVLPMPWLWNLQMPLSNKVVVMVMFGFGFATIAIMCYRIDQTIHADPDPMLAIASIGLLSNFELWLGIIVACLPTMAPFIRTHIQPHLSKLSRKLYGSSDSTEREGTPRVQLRTFGGSGGPPSKGSKGFKPRSNYTEISETATYAAQEDELHLVANEAPKITTDCKPNNTNTAPDSGGIYVQKQFQTLDA